MICASPPFSSVNRYIVPMAQIYILLPCSAVKFPVVMRGGAASLCDMSGCLQVLHTQAGKREECRGKRCKCLAMPEHLVTSCPVV